MSLQTVSRSRAEHYTWGDACDGWHLVKQESLSVIEERMPPGTSEVRHYHKLAQQFFYILSGEASMEVDGETLTLRCCEGLHIPPGVPHRIRNVSKESLEFLVISQPRSHGDRVPAGG
jgi:mannose-6-phosphate isomerase-like protein (cupin superfamily)